MKEFDCTNQFHHLFVFGDLNYGIAMRQEDIQSSVLSGDWAALHGQDELIRELRQGRALFGFKDLTPDVRYGPHFLLPPVESDEGSGMSSLAWFVDTLPEIFAGVVVLCL